MPKISVVSPCSRTLVSIKNLRHCFKNQTYDDFEHIVVYDGQPTIDIVEFFDEELKADNKLKFYIFVPRDNDWGTKPRNFGAAVATGDHVIFCDDDDIYTPNYLQSFADAQLNIDTLYVCRMNNYGGILPKSGLNGFPRHGDIGTPQCLFPVHWFKEPHNLKWRSTGEVGSHDFHIIREACEKFAPNIELIMEIGITVRGNLNDYYSV